MPHDTPPPPIPDSSTPKFALLLLSHDLPPPTYSIADSSIPVRSSIPPLTYIRQLNPHIRM
jgi:hypothetical protein